MLRKLIMFAITSGLAGKAWRAYRDSRNKTMVVRRAPAHPDLRSQPRRKVSDLPPV